MSEYTDRHGNEILASDDLDIVGNQFGVRYKEGGSPNGLIEIYTEDDENWFLVDTTNHFWIDDLINVLSEAKEHFKEKNGAVPS